MKQSFGNRSAFALELEWQHCERLADDGQRRTWATVTIVCQNVPLTLHAANGETHEDLVGPASALASWIGRNWAELSHGRELHGAEKARNGHEFLASLSDEEWDEREDALDEWLSGHSLLRVGQGAVFPNVILWNRGDCVDVSWRADPEPDPSSKIQFLASGSARLPLEAVLPVLRDFVKAVAERIEQADGLSAVRAEVLESSRAVLESSSGSAQSSPLSACSEESPPGPYSPGPKRRR